jgi:penicillin-binding protein 1A
MGVGRKRSERREPLFDATPTPGMALRLSPEDRVGGPPEAIDGKKANAGSEKGARQRRGAAAERESRLHHLDPVSEPGFQAHLHDDQEPPTARRGASGRGRKAANDDSRGRTDRRRSAGRTGRGGKGGGGRRGPLRRLAYWTVVLGLWAGIAAACVLAYVAMHLPAIQNLEVPKRPPSVQIVAAGGATLATRGEMGGASIPLKELPKYLPAAFLAIEDRRFYEHFGVDLVGVTRAMFANVLRRGVSQGGSTITQQLAKNLFLTQERTLHRKLQELVLAFWLERKFSKDQILELYVNRVYFGAGAYGVEAAAQRYFGKPAKQLSLSEAALLAGLVKSPSRLAPTRNPEGAQKRAVLVLAAMEEAGLAAPAMVKTALAHPARVAKNAGSGSANYVADWVMDVLDDLIGRYDEDLVVETTVDARLQAAAEQALVDELNQKGEKFDVEQGAMIAMTPEGAVKALVGGRNYAESQFNRAIVARRQPGSSFKPFVYLTAIERGLTPDSVREDRPISIKGWQPENYTREYFGPVTLTRALSQSLNTVSVRLTLEVTPKAVVQTAHRLGIASKLEPNASIALGTSEVSMLEMAAAFAVFANGGLQIAPHVVARVRTAGGKALYRKDATSLGRVVEPRVVGMMNAMMQETLLTGTARKGELPGRPAAGKTGTSQDFRDAWFIGYTANLVTAVWMGNDDATPTKRATGGGLPVEVWNRFMKVAHQGLPVSELPGVSTRFPAPPAPQVAASGGGRPLPPSAVDPGRPQPTPRQESVTLDRWLMDTLFGRR